MREQPRLLAREPGRVDDALRRASRGSGGARPGACRGRGSGSTARRRGRRRRSRTRAGSCAGAGPCARRPRAPPRARASRAADGRCGRARRRRGAAAPPSRRRRARARRAAARAPPRPAGRRAVALEPRDGVPARAQQRLQLVDDALLAAGGAVAVVQQQDARVRVGVARRKQGRRAHRPAILARCRSRGDRARDERAGAVPRSALRAAGRALRRRGAVLRRRRELRAGLVRRSRRPARRRAVPGAADRRPARGARARRAATTPRSRPSRAARCCRRRTSACARRGKPFVLWGSVWAHPRGGAKAALGFPLVRHVYRHADAVVTYGEHVRRYVARYRGRDDDVVIAPQSVEAELFGRAVARRRDRRLARARPGCRDGPLVLYVGRLVEEKGVEELLAGVARSLAPDPPLDARRRAPRPDARRRSATARSPTRSPPTPGARLLGPLPRERLPVAYAAADAARAALDPDAALPRAVGARLQRGAAPGHARGRHDGGRRGRRRARARRRDGPRRRRPATPRRSPARSAACSPTPRCARASAPPAAPRSPATPTPRWPTRSASRSRAPARLR